MGKMLDQLSEIPGSVDLRSVQLHETRQSVMAVDNFSTKTLIR